MQEDVLPDHQPPAASDAAYQCLGRQAAAPDLTLAQARALLAQALEQQQALLRANEQLRAARRQEEATQAFREALREVLSPVAAPEAVQQAVTQATMRHFGADRCYYCEITASEAIIRRDAARAGLPSVAGTYPLAQFPILRNVIDAGRPFSVPDVRTTDTVDEELRQLCLRLQVVSCLNVPVVRGGRPVGVLCLVQGTPRQWTAAEVALAAETAERTWTAVARGHAEQARRQSEEQYRTLFASMDQGYCIIQLLYDAQGEPVDWRFLEVNAAFEQQNGLPGATGKTVRELVPDIEPKWLRLYGQIVATGQSVRFEDESVALHRVFDFYAFRVGEPAEHTVAVLFTDVTARRQQEQRQQFLLRLSDALQPLTDPVLIQDAACRVLGQHLRVDWLQYTELDWERQVICNARDYYRDDARRAELPSHVGEYPMHVYPAHVEAWRTGRPIVVDDAANDTTLSAGERAGLLQFAVRATLSTALLKNGTAVAVLAALAATPRHWTPADVALLAEAAERTWDAVQRARAEKALRESEARLRALIASLPGAAAFVVGPDLRYQLAGGEALEAVGFRPADLLGRSVAETMPAELVGYYERHYRRALAGHGFSIEHEAHGHVYISRGVPLPGPEGRIDGVLVVSYDITARKQTEEALRVSEARLASFNQRLEQQVAERTRELRDSRDQLQSVFDTSLIAMSVMRAVRDEAGHITDFRILAVNRELERQTGRRDLVGRLYVQEYPGVVEAGIFAMLLRVVGTGQPEGREYYYGHEGLNRWYASQFVKMGDGVVSTNLDVTERRQAEQELRQSLRLLEQSEAVAQSGSWVRELSPAALQWSAGMYRLFALPPGTPVQPAIYQQYAVPDDQPAAARIVRGLTTAPADFEESLRLRVNGTERCLRIKGVVVRDATGRPLRLLGVDVDISQVKLLEADNLRLRLRQQHDQFEAVLAAQESERRRLAEALHNGLGQTLYAVKLQLDQVGVRGADTPGARAYALLADAIRQTRAISHELVPTVLAEFGLVAAVQDICRTLRTPLLRFDCHLELDDDMALPQPLQVALYRMAQELAQNIVKHAQATEASLALETVPGFVLLRAEDNGVGFPAGGGTGTGLGLRSLRDRVALLGGAVDVGSAPQVGTYVRIRIPVGAAG